MKLLLSAAAIVLAVIFLPSCGGGSSKSTKASFSDTTVVVNHTSMNGVLSDYFTIEKCVFSATHESQTFVKFEMKRTPTNFKFSVKDVTTDEWKAIVPNVLTLNAELIDNNGVPINCSLILYEKENLKKALSLSTGESIWLEFVDNKNYNELLKGLKHVKITSSMVDVSANEIAANKAFRANLNKPKESAAKVEPKKKEQVAKAKNNVKWDKALDSYEEYIESYIKLAKKANQGDMEAVTEYTNYMTKLTDLAEKMEDAGDDLTTAQLNRFVQLQTKFSQAAANLMQ